MENYNKKNILIASILVLLVIAVIITAILLVSSSRTGNLNISSSPTGASIFVDGKEKGKTPFIIEKLETGKHQIIAKKEGLADTKREIILKKGKNALFITLSPSTVNGDVFKNQLLVLTKEFEIRKSGSKNYIIALKAIYNRPSQYTSYILNLKAYKKEALSWLKNNHIDLEKVQIEYIPKEAKDL